jgi:eukaryotic-like serine/threonine-protein kinase
VGIENGSRLGQYEIIAVLGAGGMGGVYRAKDTRLGRDVAIKALGVCDERLRWRDQDLLHI